MRFLIEQLLPLLMEMLPALLTRVYSDCQTFAENEIGLSWRDLNRVRSLAAKSELLDVRSDCGRSLLLRVEVRATSEERKRGVPR